MKARAAYRRVLEVLMCLCATTAWGQGNLLTAGDFETTVAPWHCHQQDGARASAAVEAVEGAHGSKAARVTITNAGAPNHVQFSAGFEASRLAPREPYRLTFLAKADPPRAFSVHLIGAQKPWTNAGLRRDLQVGPKWQQFDLLLRAKPVRQPIVRVDFFLGETQGDVWIDHVILQRADIAGPAEPDGPRVDRRGYTVEFDKQGAVARLVHKTTGRLLVGGLQPAPAYEIAVRKAGQDAILSGRDARSIQVRRETDACIFTAQHDHCRVTYGARFGQDRLDMSISVEPEADTTVTAVSYPILHCPAKLGDASADDAVLYPRCDGGLIEDPLNAMGGQGLSELYPGPLSCQLMAYYDSAAGVSLASYDTSGRPKRFTCELGVDLRLSISHLFPRVPGRSVELPSAARIALFQGSWYEAARLYRERMRDIAPWCAKTLGQRKDMPEWLERGAMVTVYNPRATTQQGTLRFSPEGLAEFISQLTETYGLPMVPNNRGWEREGEWTGQEYFPPYPSEDRFRQDAQIIHRLGGQGMIMLSGYRWTIEKARPDKTIYDSSDTFEREVKPYVTCAADGETPSVFTSSRENDFRGRKYARLCPATEFAKQTIVDAALRCVTAGYTVMHFDQEVSGPASTGLCYSGTHGHEPGYGPWMYRDMADLLARIREACEPVDADFVLSMEEPNELFIPWLNLCQSRPNGLTTEFPMRPPLTRVVPLFSFLYHDYLVGWTAFYPWRSAGRPTYSLARGFSAGMMPGLHWESTIRWPSEARKTFDTMLANCNRAYGGPAREYLIFGRMLKPLPLSVPERTFDLGERFGSIRVPAISHSVWELPDGRRAVVLINPEGEDQQVELPGSDQSVTVPALDVAVVDLPPAG